jgi:hypothetical protein
MKESEEISELPSNRGFDVSLAEFETEHLL